MRSRDVVVHDTLAPPITLTPLVAVLPSVGRSPGGVVRSEVPARLRCSSDILRPARTTDSRHVTSGDGPLIGPLALRRSIGATRRLRAHILSVGRFFLLLAARRFWAVGRSRLDALGLLRTGGLTNRRRHSGRLG